MQLGKPGVVEDRKQGGGLWGDLRAYGLVPGTPVLLRPRRLHPDLTNDGLSYEQTGLHEHFGAGAPS